MIDREAILKEIEVRQVQIRGNTDPVLIEKAKNELKQLQDAIKAIDDAANRKK